MNIFSSDAAVRAAQREVERHAQGLQDRDEAQRMLANARELREHARWRSFSVLLFVVPALAGLLSAVVTLLVAAAFRS